MLACSGILTCLSPIGANAAAVAPMDSGTVKYSTLIASDEKTFTAYTYTSSQNCSLYTEAQYKTNFNTYAYKYYNKVCNAQTGYAMVSKEPLPSNSKKWQYVYSEHTVNGATITTTEDGRKVK